MQFKSITLVGSITYYIAFTKSLYHVYQVTSLQQIEQSNSLATLIIVLLSQIIEYFFSIKPSKCINPAIIIFGALAQ